jgi:hypothetical protein
MLFFYFFLFVGCVEVSIMHPLDLIKTRLQIQAAPPKGSLASGKLYIYMQLKSRGKLRKVKTSSNIVYIDRKKYEEDTSV